MGVVDSLGDNDVEGADDIDGSELGPLVAVFVILGAIVGIMLGTVDGELEELGCNDIVGTTLGLVLVVGALESDGDSLGPLLAVGCTVASVPDGEPEGRDASDGCWDIDGDALGDKLVEGAVDIEGEKLGMALALGCDEGGSDAGVVLVGVEVAGSKDGEAVGCIETIVGRTVVVVGEDVGALSVVEGDSVANVGRTVGSGDGGSLAERLEQKNTCTLLSSCPGRPPPGRPGNVGRVGREPVGNDGDGMDGDGKDGDRKLGWW